MQNFRVNFCLFIGFLGLLAMATGIAAEFKRTKVDQVSYVRGECTLPSSPALALGTTAAISLLLAQLTANAMGGCICCCTRDTRKIPAQNKAIATIFLFISWVTFAFAFFLLVAGSSMNQRQPYKRQWLDNDCYVVKPGVFAAAGVLSLVTVMLSIVFYLAITAKKIEDLPMYSSFVPMATPSYDSQNQSRNTNVVPAQPQPSVTAAVDSQPVVEQTKELSERQES
eukprot:Gb_27128 [translate_table: standard]